MKLRRDEMLLKLGAAKNQFRAVWRLVEVGWPEAGQPVNAQTFVFSLRKNKLREVRRREGRYLLRSNLPAEQTERLWEFYVQLTEVEGAFKNLKDDLKLRPFHHQLLERIEAHIFVAFLAYCLQVTLRGQLRRLAGGLTPRAVLEKFASMQMLDVHFPTTDGRQLIFRRYTQPEKDQKILLARLAWELPPQAPPQITAAGELLKQ